MESRPFNFLSVFVALKQVRNLIHFIVRKEWVIRDTQLIALAFHDIHRVVQNPFHNEITEFGHQHVSTRKVPHRDRQLTDVIMMTVRQCNGIQGFLRDQVIERHALATGPLRVIARIHQEPMTFHFDEPSAGANIGIGIEIYDAHGEELARIIADEQEERKCQKN